MPKLRVRPRISQKGLDDLFPKRAATLRSARPTRATATAGASTTAGPSTSAGPSAAAPAAAQPDGNSGDDDNDEEVRPGSRGSSRYETFSHGSDDIDSSDAMSSVGSDSRASTPDYTTLHDADRPFQEPTTVYRDETLRLTIEQRALHRANKYGLTDHCFLLKVKRLGRAARTRPLVGTIVVGLHHAIETAVREIKRAYAGHHRDSLLFISIVSNKMRHSINSRAFVMRNINGTQAANYIMYKFRSWLYSFQTQRLTNSLHVNLQGLVPCHIVNCNAHFLMLAIHC